MWSTRRFPSHWHLRPDLPLSIFSYLNSSWFWIGTNNKYSQKCIFSIINSCQFVLDIQPFVILKLYYLVLCVQFITFVISCSPLYIFSTKQKISLNMFISNMLGYSYWLAMTSRFHNHISIGILLMFYICKHVIFLVLVELRKKMASCYVPSIALYSSKTWTLRKLKRKYLDTFETWCWRRMEKMKWLEKVAN